MSMESRSFFSWEGPLGMYDFTDEEGPMELASNLYQFPLGFDQPMLSP